MSENLQSGQKSLYIAAMQKAQGIFTLNNHNNAVAAWWWHTFLHWRE